ncbi:MAG: type II toxin-antitoxin system RelE/ParE family toxin [Sulfuricurvum sp.]|jgi:mRNA interferase RelE/StbE|uniref:type II toxin-antitoxin system RelE family toxin n=1 Tax=Sulfuricurvum sp. TaxID=2025608 RepID=UPI0025E96B02|nr:type II toxin-antitoxin system RelE/ParE family toxin [Sulfuricurvum sp.]MCK9373658.1 type II toxin-antitoxin system RelE/ParE family toxin [Sulfuricurvum sp.]
MFKVAFEKEAQKEFLKLADEAKNLIAKKILDLQSGNFTGDKALKGKHKGKFRKRAGDYRVIYLRENELVLITIICVAHRKEVY